MKRYSTYYRNMIIAGFVFSILAMISFKFQMPNACAGMLAMAFTTLYGASMAPDSDKYKS